MEKGEMVDKLEEACSNLKELKIEFLETTRLLESSNNEKKQIQIV